MPLFGPLGRRPAGTLLTAFTVLATAWLSPAAATTVAEPPPRTATTSDVWTVAAPQNQHDALAADVVRDEATGALTLTVRRGADTVLPDSPLGLRTEGADLTRGLDVLGRDDRRVHERYEMTTGKQRRVRSAMTESRFALRGDGGVRMDLVVRVADDGVAFRYELPDSAGTVVTGEATGYTLPADAPAWLLPHTAWYENVRGETTAGGAAADEYGYPALFEVDDSYVLLTESGMDSGYPGSRLDHPAGGGAYNLELAEAEVVSEGDLATPWRTAIVGDLATVTESTLVSDLAPDSAVADTSWIRPGTVSWSWLVEHSSPADFERQKDFVDYAAAHGWEYTLVDEGWSRDWVPELVRYARAKGVDILLWYRWWEVDTPEEMDTVFGELNDWGVKGVKVDFMNQGDGDPEGVGRHAWYEDVLAATAEHELLVNFHGATIPKGIQRTWPHLMTYEAVRGHEYYTFNQPLTPTYNTMLPFTRNVVGSADVTPATFSMTNRTHTDAHELALPVVHESGLQHPADSPESYAQLPEAERVLDQLPTVWDETRYLGGRPGDDAVLARRAGERWFVGGIHAGAAGETEVDLGRLGADDDDRLLVELVTDGADGLARETRRVDGDAELTVPVAADGGFVALVCPAERGRTTCDEPVSRAPATAVTITPETATAAAGDEIEVSGRFAATDDVTLRDVTLGARPWAGWTAAGDDVERSVLRPGRSLAGTWTVRVPENVRPGYADVPVAAEFRRPGAARGEPPVHVEQAVRVLIAPPVPQGEAHVGDLPFLSAANGWGPVETDTSVGDQQPGDGEPLTIGGTTYAKGLGAHAPSRVTVYLGGACTSFTAQVGVDDEVGDRGSVSFRVLGDDTELAATANLRGTDAAQPVTADVTGVDLLTLEVADGGDGISYDHADWAEPVVSCA
ncbi:glycoside hydrolase family 97 catalytic domain-containing protein [Streptomyces sp. WMMC500]|uniref:glycoside hydrolase family 97 catalytic domain-containing protein n=1 Tax=Streptomyces sp. WMMC500 TaxID=3015154 RepID=UPI00248B1D21|nr:glycoside hydrolase family 97 catalytic domain-containing protein [Streptomyces sp. WMMC500]WBB64105.1 glycoside hydrolase family 97 catalytic domain-containing protein [Streptomyces sp. WMMC500]